MTSRLTRNLVLAATLSNSFLAGLNINRALVDMPAWRQVGVRGWAAFSRHADLAPRAAIMYPFAAFSGLITSIAAVISFRREGTPAAASGALAAAGILAAGGLLMTIEAAPNMLRVRDLGDDEAALQAAFDGFEFWGGIRGVFQVLAFLANLWSLVAVLTPTRKP